jgi:hypothetical protein
VAQEDASERGAPVAPRAARPRRAAATRAPKYAEPAGDSEEEEDGGSEESSGEESDLSGGEGVSDEDSPCKWAPAAPKPKAKAAPWPAPQPKGEAMLKGSVLPVLAIHPLPLPAHRHHL